MKGTAYLILALLALPGALFAGDLSVGLGYPYGSVKYDFTKLAAEARLVTGGGVKVYAGRGYWNFHRSPGLKGFAGLEAGYITFDTMAMKGTGYECALFVGGSYPVADNFYVLMDFAPTLIVLRHGLYKDVEVGGMEYVVNLGFYYRFGRKSRKASPAPRKVETEARPPAAAVPVSTAGITMQSAPPQVSTAAQAAAEAAEAGDLLKKLESVDWKERREAAFELGGLKYAAAVGPLTKLLDDENDKVRGVSALALGRIGDLRALLPLMLALSDDSDYVRASAAKSLGQLRDKRALIDLEAAAKDKAKKVRQAAVEAIKQINAQSRAKN